MTSSVTTYRGWTALLLENDLAQLIVLPDLGGKIASLYAKDTGTEFLWQDPNRPYQPRIYGDDYGNSDASGFDECFPSIGACLHPDAPWEQSAVPDHGELWCIPWRYELLDDQTIYLHAYGIRFPYHFEKWISLAADMPRYQIRYRVTNLSPFPFTAMWSSHPLFAAQEGMQVLLPGAPSMRLSHALGTRITTPIHAERHWPWLDGSDGTPLDYSRIGSPALQANDKIYANSPAEGWCALYSAANEEFVAFTFSASEIPFIGVCINHAGWPSSDPTFWVAIEPCSGWPDRLDEAALGTAMQFLPWASRTWSLGVQFGRAATADQVARNIRDVG